MNPAPASLFYQLKTRLKKLGAECRIISVDHIPELESEYKLSLSNLNAHNKFIRESMQNYIDFSVAEKYPEIRSLIVIATPSSEVEVKLNCRGKIHYFKIPPHYSDRLKINRDIKNITSQIIEANGYQTFPVVLPKKLLAVHSGLAKYGKNNIAYVPGMGSYHRLTAFASDLQCDDDSWKDLQILEKCSSCKACQINCPTGAIGSDQFMIKTERCLTHFNEHLGPFPEWVDPKSHNSIIGCIRCQSVCPENMKYKSAAATDVAFSRTETNLILNETPFEELPEKLQLKINHLSLQHYYKNLSRNIMVLIENEVNKTPI